MSFLAGLGSFFGSGSAAAAAAAPSAGTGNNNNSPILITEERGKYEACVAAYNELKRMKGSTGAPLAEIFRLVDQAIVAIEANVVSPTTTNVTRNVRSINEIVDPVKRLLDNDATKTIGFSREEKRQVSQLLSCISIYARQIKRQQRRETRRNNSARGRITAASARRSAAGEAGAAAMVSLADLQAQANEAASSGNTRRHREILTEIRRLHPAARSAVRAGESAMNSMASAIAYRERQRATNAAMAASASGAAASAKPAGSLGGRRRGTRKGRKGRKGTRRQRRH
jgi:hypothetical protein